MNFPSQVRTNRNLQYGIMLVLVAVFVIVLFAKGYPTPYPDDLATIGSALSMAQGKGFSNPYVREWLAAFPTERPYYYPPGMTYLLAGWMKVFGVNTSALLAYQWLFMLMGAGALFRYLTKTGNLAPWISFVGSIAYLLAFQADGFRSEVPAYGLSFLGLVICLRSGKFSKTAGFLLLAFSGVVYPAAPCLSIPLYPAAIILSLQPEQRDARTFLKRIARDIPYALFASVAVFGIFYLMIRGEFSEFTRVLLINKELSITGGFFDRLGSFWHLSTAFSQVMIRLPLLVITLLAIVASIGIGRHRKNLHYLIPVAFALSCLICIETNPLRSKSLVPILEIATLLYVIASLLPGKILPAIAVGAFFAFLINLKVVLSVLLQKPVDANQVAAMKSEVSQIDHRSHHVLICPWAARYLYDYKIPFEGNCLTMWATVPKVHTRNGFRYLKPREKGPDEIWIGSKEYLSTNIAPEERDGLIPSPVRFMGKTFGNIASSQADFIVWK